MGLNEIENWRRTSYACRRHYHNETIYVCVYVVEMESLSMDSNARYIMVIIYNGQALHK